jgi:hypothetical protein
MLKNGLRILLRWGAEHGIGLSSIRMIAAMICFVFIFVSLHVFIHIGVNGPSVQDKVAGHGSQEVVRGKDSSAPGSNYIASPSIASQGGVMAAASSENVPGSGNGASGSILPDKIPFVLQISQGRSGSTLTGTMMLEHHPACGLYLDELVMVVSARALVQGPCILTVNAGRRHTHTCTKSHKATQLYNYTHLHLHMDSYIH